MSGKKRETIDLDTLSRDIRRLLNDQQVCMDMRTDGKLSLLNDFAEFFKKRGEVELEYAKSLDKLVDRFEKSAKRNAKFDLKSSVHVWNSLLSETRRLAKEHTGQAEAYSSEMNARYDVISKDVHLLTKKCKEMTAEVQETLLKDFRDLSEQSKAYQYSCLNCNDAYAKLIKAREKTAKANPKRRDKLEEKERERERLFLEAKFRQLKFRNDFILSIAACNGVTQKYFSNDVLDIIETVDYDYHAALTRAVAAYRDIEYCLGKIRMASVDHLEQEATKKLDFIGDRSAFMQENQILFTPPPAVQFIASSEDEPSEYMVTEGIQDACQDLQTKFARQRSSLSVQVEETAKTLEHMNVSVLSKYKIVTVQEAQVLLEEMVNAQETSPHDLSKSASFERGLTFLNKGSQVLAAAQRGKRVNLEFTLDIFQRKLQTTNSLQKTTALLNVIDRGLMNVLPGDIPGEGGMARRVPSKVNVLPQLFKGNLVEYVKRTPGDVPMIVLSCVRVIEENGMDMEGIFRVPGPAQTVEDLRKAFEDGVNPLTSASVKRNKTDNAAIASVLKQYFRELEDPLFPQDRYSKFIECARIEDVHTRCDAIKQTIVDLQPIIVHMMQYIFAFLYRVAAHEATNKMSSANLATVFGPTLTRAPHTVDTKQLHHDVPAVNVLIQTCIENHCYIFGEAVSSSSTTDSTTQVHPSSSEASQRHASPVEVDGRVSTARSREPTPVGDTGGGSPSPVQGSGGSPEGQPPAGDSPEDDDQDEEDDESDSDEDTMTLTVKANFDYEARNEKELSFLQGDLLHVIEKTPDNNWWDGMREGKRGFIPVAYVEIFHPSGSLTSLQSPVPPNRNSSLTDSPIPDLSTQDTEEDAPKVSVPEISVPAEMPKTPGEPVPAPEPQPVPKSAPPVPALDLKDLSPESSASVQSPVDRKQSGGPLSPVSEEDKIKAQMRSRAASSVSTTLKAKMAAFEGSNTGLVPTAGGHHRSVSVDDTANFRRTSEGHGALAKKLSNLDGSQPAQHSRVAPKGKTTDKGPSVKELAQQGLPFAPMPHGSYPAASPLQRSVLLRQAEQPAEEETSKKKASKPPVLNRPPRLSGKRESQPAKPKNDSLSAELRAVVQAKSHPH